MHVSITNTLISRSSITSRKCINTETLACICIHIHYNRLEEKWVYFYYQYWNILKNKNNNHKLGFISTGNIG